MPGAGSVFLGAAFYQQRVGLRQLDKGTWLVSFMDIDIGHVDVSTKRIIDLLEPENSVKV